MRAKRFAIGFILGLVIFIAINLLAAQFMSDCGLPAVFGMSGCADDIVRAGIPFPFYEEGGFAYRRDFNTAPLALDIVLEISASGWLGLWWAKRKGNAEK